MGSASRVLVAVNVMKICAVAFVESVNQSF